LLDGAPARTAPLAAGGGYGGVGHKTGRHQLAGTTARQPRRSTHAWESEEACAKAFAERIHPAVDAAFGGTRPPMEPTVHHLDVIDASGTLLAGDKP